MFFLLSTSTEIIHDAIDYSVRVPHSTSKLEVSDPKISFCGFGEREKNCCIVVSALL